jgi:large subunit ribosomal protein L10
MPTQRKNESIKELRARVESHPNFFLTDYRGLTVGEMRTLRVTLRKSAAEYAVIKNTLFGKAIGDDKLDELKPLLEGPTGIAFAGDDVIAAVKALVQFANDSKKLKIKAGFVDGLLYDLKKIEALSKVPSRPELLGRLVGSLKSPLYGLHNVLHGSKRKLVLALSAIHTKKSEATSAA